MPALRSLALGAALLGGVAFAGQPKNCPVTDQTPLSCHNTTAVPDTCCFNAPGGQILQTQFWDVGDGPSDSWTIHGLWPDNCDGTYQANCDKKREYTNISAIIGAKNKPLLDYMNKYWKDNKGQDETFWAHEWGKHGTCMSTFNTNCYQNYEPQEEVVDFFNKTVSLFQTLNSYKFLTDAGIQPSTSKTYTLQQITDALKKGHGAVPAVSCTGKALDQIWYFYNVQGNAQNGKYVPTDPDGAKSACPSDGIQWPPKSGGGGGGSSTSPAPTSTPKPTQTGKPHHNKPVVPRWV